MRKQSCRRTSGKRRHLMKKMEKNRTILLMALWSTTHTSPRDWTVISKKTLFYSIISGFDFKSNFLNQVFQFEEAGGIDSHSLALPVCSPLYQTQRCTGFTWSQWEALQYMASSKCPTETITTWTYFPRYILSSVLQCYRVLKTRS